MRYNSEEEIISIVASFEHATIGRDDWKHAEHLTVALYYLNHYDIAGATEKMRSGIFKLLTVGFGIDLSTDMPYHETMTVFWMRVIAGFNAARSMESLLNKANEVVEIFDKEYPLRFYSRELLFSEKARGEFVEADIEAVI